MGKKAKKKAKVKKAAKRKAAKKVKHKAVKKKAVHKKAVHKKVAHKKAAKHKAAKRKPLAKFKAPAKPMFEKISPAQPPQPATGDNPYNIKIVNMVASANFNVELDLFALAREVDTIEYEPEQFPGAILKLQKPKASLLLFKNGKVICTGARSEEDVEKALMRTTEIISKFVT